MLNRAPGHSLVTVVATSWAAGEVGFGTATIIQRPCLLSQNCLIVVATRRSVYFFVENSGTFDFGAGTSFQPSNE